MRMSGGAADPEIASAAKAAGILTGAGLLTGASNFAFNVIIARASGAERYGAIGTLVSLITVAGFLAIGAGYAVARRAAITELPSRQVFVVAIRSTGPWFLVLVPLVALVKPIADFLHLSGVGPVLMAFATVAAMLAGSLASGVLLGRGRFRLIAGLTIGNALLRLLLGALLPLILPATEAALLATLGAVFAANAVAIVLVLRPAHTATRLPRAPLDQLAARDVGVRLTGDSVAGAIGSMALWAVWTAPLVIATHSLSATRSGRFAAAQVLASAILILVAPITSAFFPTIARYRRSSAIRVGALCTAALALVCAIALALLGPMVMGRLYGPAFAASMTLFVAMGSSAIAIALATYALWAARARHGRHAEVTVIAFIALGLEGLCGGLLHPSGDLLAVLPLLTVVAAAAATRTIDLLMKAGAERRSRGLDAGLTPSVERSA